MTAMSDIVWAISPERDSSDELVRKMREYAGEVCPDIALTFTGPDGARASRLGPDGRREVYLIFKEAMNNIARHADATAVDVRLVIEARGLVLEVRDNGTGFEPGAPNDGNGLVSIRRRADRLGAQLTITPVTFAKAARVARNCFLCDVMAARQFMSFMFIHVIHVISRGDHV
jgi:signal transduction histidine kinase